METTESTQEHTPPDWSATVVDLTHQLEQARADRDALDKKRRLLLLPAVHDPQAKRELDTLGVAVEVKRREIHDLEETLTSARAAAAEQQQTRKAEAVTELRKMLRELTAERDKLVEKARKGDDEALERAYVLHRQAYGLGQDLYDLTHSRGFHAMWNLSAFGADLQYAVSQLHNLARTGGLRIDSPWKSLLAIARGEDEPR